MALQKMCNNDDNTSKSYCIPSIRVDSKGGDWCEDVGVFFVRKLLNLGSLLILGQKFANILALSQALTQI